VSLLLASTSSLENKSTASIPAKAPTQDSSPSVGVIAGGIASGVAGLALFVLIVCLLLRRKRKSAVEAQGKLGRSKETPTESAEVQHWAEVGDHTIH
jgi:hypothetical protein